MLNAHFKSSSFSQHEREQPARAAPADITPSKWVRLVRRMRLACTRDSP